MVVYLYTTIKMMHGPINIRFTHFTFNDFFSKTVSFVGLCGKISERRTGHR